VAISTNIVEGRASNNKRVFVILKCCEPDCCGREIFCGINSCAEIFFKKEERSKLEATKSEIAGMISGFTKSIYLKLS